MHWVETSFFLVGERIRERLADMGFVQRIRNRQNRGNRSRNGSNSSRIDIVLLLSMCSRAAAALVIRIRTIQPCIHLGRGVMLAFGRLRRVLVVQTGIGRVCEATVLCSGGGLLLQSVHLWPPQLWASQT